MIQNLDLVKTDIQNFQVPQEWDEENRHKIQHLKTYYPSTISLNEQHMINCHEALRYIGAILGSDWRDQSHLDESLHKIKFYSELIRIVVKSDSDQISLIPDAIKFLGEHPLTIHLIDFSLRLNILNLVTSALSRVRDLPLRIPIRNMTQKMLSSVLQALLYSRDYRELVMKNSQVLEGYKGMLTFFAAFTEVELKKVCSQRVFNGIQNIMDRDPGPTTVALVTKMFLILHFVKNPSPGPGIYQTIMSTPWANDEKSIRHIEEKFYSNMGTERIPRFLLEFPIPH